MDSSQKYTALAVLLLERIKDSMTHSDLFVGLADPSSKTAMISSSDSVTTLYGILLPFLGP
jgi:hypothetical protein